MLDSERPLCRAIEALLLAAERPLQPSFVADLFNRAVDDEEWPTQVTPDEVIGALRSLAAIYRSDNRGIEVAEVAEGWRLRTRVDMADIVRRLWPNRPWRLSKAALECLSVIAYRQPVTRVEVEDIRGVDCGGVLRSLLERKLVCIIGKKDEPGRPLLYGTTHDFLEMFDLPNLRAMPTLRDLESMRVEEEARQRGSREE